MIVVADNEYPTAIKKLESAGFVRSVPNRAPPPEIMEDHPNPKQMLETINAGYKRLDRSCAVFDYPRGDPAEEDLQVHLLPNSFASATTQQFETHGNLQYPLEQTLVESFVKAVIDEEKEAGFTMWSAALRSWVSMMTGYLEVNNDILDHCPDTEVVEWYSANFGRAREAEFGPFDRRITKRLGSGKELPVDMRGNPI